MYHPSGSVVSPLSTHSPSILWSTVPVALPTRIGDPSGTSTVLAQPLAHRTTSSAQKSSVDISIGNGAALAEPFEKSDDDSGGDAFKHFPSRP